jgi:hypothetical protein
VTPTWVKPCGQNSTKGKKRPAYARTKRNFWPFKHLKVGQAFKVAQKLRTRVEGLLYYYKKHHNMKFAVVTMMTDHRYVLVCRTQ